VTCILLSLTCIKGLNDKVSTLLLGGVATKKARLSMVWRGIQARSMRRSTLRCVLRLPMMDSSVKCLTSCATLVEARASGTMVKPDDNEAGQPSCVWGVDVAAGASERPSQAATASFSSASTLSTTGESLPSTTGVCPRASWRRVGKAFFVLGCLAIGFGLGITSSTSPAAHLPETPRASRPTALGRVLGLPDDPAGAIVTGWFPDHSVSAEPSPCESPSRRRPAPSRNRTAVIPSAPTLHRPLFLRLTSLPTVSRRSTAQSNTPKSPRRAVVPRVPFSCPTGISRIRRHLSLVRKRRR
jgi:hypothetical protein